MNDWKERHPELWQAIQAAQVEQIDLCLRQAQYLPDEIEQIGWALFQTGLIKMAETLWLQLLQATPQRAQSQLNVAEFQDLQGNLEAAQAYYQAALNLQPGPRSDGLDAFESAPQAPSDPSRDFHLYLAEIGNHFHS